jgi:hypothetical protein
MSVPDMIEQAYAEPDPHPYYFSIGSSVRLKKGQSDDGQIDQMWDGAWVTILSFYCTGIHKEHWYKVRHLNRWTAEFAEYDFDQRFAKRQMKAS